jgi:Mn2+/Fe2+ NRAMP family transporter
MGVVQEMCARLGMVTGRGLAENIKLRYPPWVLYGAVALLCVVNVINIGADLGAMAEAVKLLADVPAMFVVIILAVVIILLEVFTSYKVYSEYLKFSVIALFSYIVVGFLVNMDWMAVLRHALVPTLTFSRDELLIVCAILGTTISPYLFFWQSSQEVEEEILLDKLPAMKGLPTPGDIRDMRVDIWTGMFASNIVMFFIIISCASTLYANNIQVVTAADAAKALEPLAHGMLAKWLFALGIIGTGLLAIPVLAGSAAYAIAEALGWKEGLYKKYSDAKAFYGIIAVTIFGGVLFNVLGLDPIKALIYAAVGNGIVAPIILFFIVRLTNDVAVVGTFTNGRLSAAIGWACVAIMGIVGTALAASTIL